VRARLVDRDDVRVAQPGHRLRLGTEARQALRAGVLGGEDHLQGDHAAQLDLAGLVDDAHAPPPQLPQDLVPRQGRQGPGFRRLRPDKLPGDHRNGDGRQQRIERGQAAVPQDRGRAGAHLRLLGAQTLQDRLLLLGRQVQQPLQQGVHGLIGLFQRHEGRSARAQPASPASSPCKNCFARWMRRYAVARLSPRAAAVSSNGGLRSGTSSSHSSGVAPSVSRRPPK
jgi:hypothetical protein